MCLAAPKYLLLHLVLYIYVCLLWRDRLKGSTTFRQNYGNYGGAIFNQAVSHPFNSLEDDADYDIPVIVYPEDTVFEDNYGQVRRVRLSQFNVAMGVLW